MLAQSQIKDLFTGKLPDDLAKQYLVELNQQKLSSALIHEVVSNIKDATDLSALQQWRQSLAAENDLIDCCGTAGSGMPRFNTSTSVAFVLAAGGLKVAKFGNRSSSGGSGSFDFLELLGIPISLPVNHLNAMLEKENLVFLFAPQFYPSLAKLSPIRKSIGGQTIFNVIGPLLNPLNPGLRILGTAKKESQLAIADYLSSLASNKNSFVILADSGTDEMDPASKNSMLIVNKSSIAENFIAAVEPGANTSCFLSTSADNARLFNEMLNDFSSAPRYLQLLITLNAAAGFLLAGKVKDIEAGQKFARELFKSGHVRAKFQQCRSRYAQYT
jgi:anthranilate phosphoribosyltransferase